MDTKKHKAILYTLALGAVALAGNAQIDANQATEKARSEIHRSTQHDWQTLGQSKTEALADALKKIPPQHVTLYCASPTCEVLRADVDDALQIIAWPSEFEDRQVDSEQDKGVFVGPPGPVAEAVADAIEKTTNIKPHIVGISGIEGVGIIFGKASK